MSHQNTIIRLEYVETLRLEVTEPFHFRCTLWKPSHFSTGLEVHTQSVSWRTFRFDSTFCGIRFEMSCGQLQASVFVRGPWNDKMSERLVRRIETAYGLKENLTPFLAQASQIQALADPIRVLAGMRMSCPESLFEIAVVSLLLQNTTIQRSTQMMGNILTKYGHRVEFNDITLWCFFSPTDIVNISEEEFRIECRLGYRAKYLSAFARFFTNINDDELREMPQERVLEALQTIKGVGPYTA